MRLTVTSHVTLDGVMQSNGKPEPELNDDFAQGGWQVPYLDEDLGKLVGDWMAAADAFLMGRRTYELFAGHWALITDPADVLAAKLNGMPKYVVSTTLRHLDWSNSTLLQGDVFEAVAQLKRQPGNELQVHGSAALVRTLMERELIDEYRVLIHPVVLGNGKRLFAEGTPPTALTLVDTMSTGRGVVAHVYQPSGKPHYGAVGLKQEGDVVRSETA
jgi:dihydrofolate reductase